MNIFVKFVQYNDKTLLLLKNKEIKFSKVWEFNDCNEMSLLQCSDVLLNEAGKSLKQEIENKLKDFDFRMELFETLNKMYDYKDEALKELTESIYKYCGNSDFSIFTTDKFRPSMLMEAIAYTIVGIFCVSSLEVFKSEKAQIMFSHYADNLKGLALIYELKKEPYRINYDWKRASGGPGLSEWLKGDYSDMNYFIKKANKWEYEDERRLFGKPGIVSAGEYATLQGIFFTNRFNKENKKTLDNINKKFYENTIFIEEIYPSCSKPHFKIRQESVFEWLIKNIVNVN